jgi:quinol monooxygenase YgiN
MIAIVATMHVKLDRADEFEKVVRELEVAVAAHEPDCLLYRMARDRKDPSIYRSLEIFRDQAAIDFHMAQDHFKAALGGMRACLTATASTVEFMDTVA